MDESPVDEVVSKFEVRQRCIERMHIPSQAKTRVQVQKKLSKLVVERDTFCFFFKRIFNE